MLMDVEASLPLVPEHYFAQTGSEVSRSHHQLSLCSHQPDDIAARDAPTNQCADFHHGDSPYGSSCISQMKLYLHAHVTLGF